MWTLDFLLLSNDSQVSGSAQPYSAGNTDSLRKMPSDELSFFSSFFIPCNISCKTMYFTQLYFHVFLHIPFIDFYSHCLILNWFYVNNINGWYFCSNSQSSFHMTLIKLLVTISDFLSQDQLSLNGHLHAWSAKPPKYIVRHVQKILFASKEEIIFLGY